MFTLLMSAVNVTRSLSLLGHACVIPDCSHAEWSKLGLQAGGQSRNAVRCPPVEAQAQLNVSYDMTLA